MRQASIRWVTYNDYLGKEKKNSKNLKCSIFKEIKNDIITLLKWYPTARVITAYLVSSVL